MQDCGHGHGQTPQATSGGASGTSCACGVSSATPRLLLQRSMSLAVGRGSAAVIHVDPVKTAWLEDEPRFKARQAFRLRSFSYELASSLAPEPVPSLPLHCTLQRIKLLSAT